MLLCFSFLVTSRWTKFDPVKNTESQYDCVPYMRYGHSASLISELAFIFGGRNDKYGACNTLYCFDTGRRVSPVSRVSQAYEKFHVLMLCDIILQRVDPGLSSGGVHHCKRGVHYHENMNMKKYRRKKKVFKGE